MQLYRRDIDGLRAIAVLSVLLFHAGISAIGGGFVGVDVFFVISGYLITTQILDDLEANAFHFGTFWIRRARRILPPLIVVVLCSLAAGWFVLGPTDFRHLGQSAFAQSVFTSNVLFWLQAGYFDTAAERKPLLHTWSLSIEEQFYLVFPLILVLLTRYVRGWRTHGLILLAAFSFAISVWWVSHRPPSAFYLILSRAWELLLGALLAIYLFGQARKHSLSPPASTGGHVPAGNRWGDELLGLIGLGAIAAAVLRYDNTTPFPGAAALLPCVGAAAVIWSSRRYPSVVGKCLSLRPMVWIGLISYSLYLWHWPLLVLARYKSLDQPSWEAKAIVVATSFLLAWLSYRYVELPIRRARILPARRQVVAAAVLASSVVATLGISVHLANGFPARLPEEALVFAAARNEFNARGDECGNLTPEQIKADNSCVMPRNSPVTKVSLMVIGDSHASAAMPVLDKLAGEFSVKALFASRGGCPAILGVDLAGHKNSARCNEFSAAVLDAIKRNNIRTVLLITRWELYWYGRDEHGGNTGFLEDDTLSSTTPAESKAVFMKNLSMTIKTLSDLGIAVYIMEQVPAHKLDVPATLVSTVMAGGDPSRFGRPAREHYNRQGGINLFLDGLKSKNVHVLDPVGIFCSEDKFCRAEQQGRSLYMDDNHLTEYGSMLLKPLFEPVFRTFGP